MHTFGVMSIAAATSEVFYTGVMIDQWDAIYGQSDANPPYYSNSTPSSHTWAKSANMKYRAFDAAIAEYHNAPTTKREFLNYALTVAYDWEYWAAGNPMLLQSYYKTVLPYRTGGITKPLGQFPQTGRKFAALTSAVADAKIMQACARLLQGEPKYGHGQRLRSVHTTRTNSTRLHAAAWLAMNQELQFDVRAQHNRWYKYNANKSINPIVIHKMFPPQSNTTVFSSSPEYGIEFIPQFIWVAMLLDIVVPWTFGTQSQSQRVRSMAAKGAKLWEQAAGMVKVAQDTLQHVKKVTGNSDGGDFVALLGQLVADAEKFARSPHRKQGQVKLSELLQLYSNTTSDLTKSADNPKPHVRSATVDRFRSLLKQLNLI